MTTLLTPSMARQLRRGRPADRRGLAMRFVNVLETWLERRRQRRTLLELNDHLLKDIGVTRLEAQREGHKPFWLP